MADGLPHVVIRSETGSGNDTTITVDGVPLSGVSRYMVTHEAGDVVRVTLDLIPASVTIDHPAAVLVALEHADEAARPDRAGDLAQAEGELRHREHASTPNLDEFARTRTDYPTLEARAIAGTQLDGVDVARLAERYVDLTPERRDAARLAVGLPASGVMEPIGDAFSLAHEAGKLKEFDAAVREALTEQCEDEARFPVVGFGLHAACRHLHATNEPCPVVGVTTIPCDSEGEE